MVWIIDFTPYTVEQYLRSAGVGTIGRILGLGGYKVDSVRLVCSSSAGGTKHTFAVLAPSAGSSGTGDLTASNVTAGGTWNAFTLNITGSDVANEAYALSFNTSSMNNFVSEVISTSPLSQLSNSSDSSVYVYKIFKCPQL